MTTLTATPAEITRDQVPEHLTWNLSSIYATDQAWEADFAALALRLPEIAKFDGKVKDSAESLAACLLTRDSIYTVLDKLYVYASMRKDQDTANDLYKGMFQRVRSLWIKTSGTASFIHPQVLKIAKSRLKGWVAANETLKLYTR